MSAVSNKFAEYAALVAAAEAAGMAAGNAALPAPMIVTGTNGATGAVKHYYVSEGACGFAWIVVRPGTSSFAKWLVANGKARKHYAGGVCVWVGEFNQSVDRKSAYAYAYAGVLQAAGIKAFADSRLD